MAQTKDLAPPAVFLNEPTPVIHITVVDGNTHQFAFYFTGSWVKMAESPGKGKVNAEPLILNTALHPHKNDTYCTFKY